ncbi:hypothetical protein C882_0584 [Caenispirillum salinarum AK4]|uniref:Uncharacterized protein n=1 Tax=Caenispirillum salinarum AK4 TaxID=1238182 RepID=K9GVN8_9PROT|nr:hypothetical protein [Caenispirillum salinarum]EKV29277.1 hypothetical protein C882_0584 [Caenispirillum salinarum AK4]
MTAEADRKTLIEETPERHERHARRWSGRASYREALMRLSAGSADDHHFDNRDGGKRRASG